MAASDRINYTVVRDKSEGSFTTRAKVDKGNIVNNDHGRGDMAEMLVFPSDVGAAPGLGNQGHYIMFFMNETLDPSIGVGESSDQGETIVSKIYHNELKYNPEGSIKQLTSWKQTLTAAGELARKDRGEKAIITKDDIQAVGGKQIFKEFQESYKNVPIWKEISNQSIQGLSKEMEKQIAAANAAFNTEIAGYKNDLHSGSTGSTASIKRKETKKLKGGIALYMPPAISTSSSAEYTDTEIGVGASMASAFMDTFNKTGVSGLGANVTATLNSMGPEAKEAIQNIALGSIGAVPGLQGAKALRDLKRGFIRAPRMELAFKGIGKRNFSYEFKMIPKDEEESRTIQKIVTAFRANMLPEFTKGADRSSRFFKMPNTFDISYMYNGQENPFIHKISTCVCKSVNVSYGGGDRYQVFEDTKEAYSDQKAGAPTETSISLQFEELELITQERVLEGY